jgi:FkbM family methyltransferase
MRSMSQHPPAPGASESPAGAPPEARAGTPRRAFLLGGIVGGVVGAGAGALVGRRTAPDRTVEVERPLPDNTKLSFAQYGEDLIAASLFDSIGVPKPTYMDIGAFEPIASNNTYFFYLRGARGLLVEPNPPYVEKLKVARPEDAVMGAGIGITDAAEADYYIMSQPQQNTFDKEQAERLDRDNVCKIVRVMKMPLVNINRAIAEHFGGVSPDYLSIDVEGLEFAILKTLDFKRFRPKVICADTLVTGTHRHNPASTEYLLANGYDLRGMSFANTLYIDKSLLKK